MASPDLQPHFIFQAGRKFPQSGSWLYYSFSAVWAPAQVWFRLKEVETHTDSHTLTHAPVPHTLKTHTTHTHTHTYSTHHSHTQTHTHRHSCTHPHIHTTHTHSQHWQHSHTFTHMQLIIEFVRKFIRVFPKDHAENPKQTFWPTQYTLTYTIHALQHFYERTLKYEKTYRKLLIKVGESFAPGLGKKSNFSFQISRRGHCKQKQRFRQWYLKTQDNSLKWVLTSYACLWGCSYSCLALWFAVAVRTPFHLPPITMLFSKSVERRILRMDSWGDYHVHQVQLRWCFLGEMSWSSGKWGRAGWGWVSEEGRQEQGLGGSRWGSCRDGLLP